MLVNRYLKLLSPMGTEQQNHAFVVFKAEGASGQSGADAPGRFP